MAVSPAYIVDADPQVCNALRFLLATMSIECQWFAKVDEFLDRASDLMPGCVLLDLHLPASGADRVFQMLNRRNLGHAVVIMSANADPIGLHDAMRHGAVGHLEMPFDEGELDRALQLAFDHLSGGSRNTMGRAGMARLIESLDAIQTLVLRGIVAGMSTRQIASTLQLTQLQARRIRAGIADRLGLQRTNDLVAASHAADLTPLPPAARRGAA